MLKSTINNKGFSIIEALVAISILVIGLMAIISIFPLILNVNKRAERTTVASALARAKIEELMVIPYDELTVGIYEPLSPVTTDTTSPLYIYKRQTVISYVNSNLATSQTDLGLKKIVTTIIWPEKQGTNNGSLVLTSLRARK